MKLRQWIQLGVILIAFATYMGAASFVEADAQVNDERWVSDWLIYGPGTCRTLEHDLGRYPYLSQIWIDDRPIRSMGSSEATVHPLGIKDSIAMSMVTATSLLICNEGDTSVLVEVVLE